MNRKSFKVGRRQYKTKTVIVKQPNSETSGSFQLGNLLHVIGSGSLDPRLAQKLLEKFSAERKISERLVKMIRKIAGGDDDDVDVDDEGI